MAPVRRGVGVLRVWGNTPCMVQQTLAAWAATYACMYMCMCQNFDLACATGIAQALEPGLHQRVDGFGSSGCTSVTVCRPCRRQQGGRLEQAHLRSSGSLLLLDLGCGVVLAEAQQGEG